MIIAPQQRLCSNEEQSLLLFFFKRLQTKYDPSDCNRDTKEQRYYDIETWPGSCMYLSVYGETTQTVRSKDFILLLENASKL